MELETGDSGTLHDVVTHPDYHGCEADPERAERVNGQRHTFGEICENSDDIVKDKQKAMRFVEEGFVRKLCSLFEVLRGFLCGPQPIWA